MTWELYIWRVQPYTNKHNEIITKAIEEGKDICIGVLDTPVSDANPLNAGERIEMLKIMFYGRNVKIFPIPFADKIVLEEPDGINMVAIKKQMAGNKEDWVEEVPRAISFWIKKKSVVGKVLWFTGADHLSIVPMLYQQIYQHAALFDDKIYVGELCGRSMSKAAKIIGIMADLNKIVLCILCSNSRYDDALIARGIIGSKRFLHIHLGPKWLPEADLNLYEKNIAESIDLVLGLIAKVGGCDG